MPVVTIIVILLASSFLFAQFGGRLSARHSVVWLMVTIFLLVAAIFPKSLTSTASFFGFQLVSNFVLSALAFASFFELLQQSFLHTRSSRRLRDALCREAAEKFSDKQLAENNIDVLVVSPCYNEQVELPRTIARLAEMQSHNPRFRFCIVDDGSADSSQAILKAQAPQNFTRHLTNMGVSAALLSGFYAAKSIGAQFVVQCDSDGQHPIEEIPHIVARAEQLNSDLLIGSRFVGNASTINSLESTTWQRWLGGRLISLALRTFGSAVSAKDPTSGFRVYSARAIDLLIRNMPDDYPEPESIAILGAAGLKIFEIPTAMQARASGVSSLSGKMKSTKFMFKVAVALLGLRLRIMGTSLK